MTMGLDRTYHAHRFILVSYFNFLFVLCGGLISWLPVSFLLHVKYTVSYRIVSYGQTDRQTLRDSKDRAYASHRSVIKLCYNLLVLFLCLHRSARINRNPASKIIIIKVRPFIVYNNMDCEGNITSIFTLELVLEITA